MRGQLIVVAALMLPAAAGAQEAASPEPEPCPAGVISRIGIHNGSVFDLEDPGREERFDWVFRTANALHVRTRESVIRREILLRPGACWDPWLAEESERLLRAMAFIADASVTPVPQPDGAIAVVVETRDEWSTWVLPRARIDGGIQLGGIEVTEQNLLGTGQTVGGRIRQDYDTGIRSYLLHYAHPQLLRTRWRLQAEGGRSRAGAQLAYTLEHPFIGEVGRWAAEQGFTRSNEHFVMQLDDDARVLIPVLDQSFRAALLTRIGRPGNLTLFGTGVVHQRFTYPGGIEAVRLDVRGEPGDEPLVDPEAAAALEKQMGDVASARLLFILGQRNLWWMRMRGLDAVRAEQDVPLGAEARLALGRPISAIERDDDISTTFTLYTGADMFGALVFTRGRVDARRRLDAPADSAEWEDVLAEGELLVYLRPRAVPGHTLVLHASGEGGWHTSTPFQLTLGGDRGMRGLGRERFPGGRRLVLTAEDRFALPGPFAHLLDLGGAVFAETGRVWAGDAPFGGDSGWRYSLGLGLRGAFPAGSRTTHRLDVTFPLGGGEGGVRITFSSRDRIGLGSRFEAEQVQRSRHSGLTGDIFRFDQQSECCP